MSETQYDPRLFAEFFEWQPQAFIWLEPVWNESGTTIIDFRYVYSNPIGLDYLKLTGLMLQKITIFNTPSLTDAMRTPIFNEMVQVYLTGVTSSTELYNPVINKHGRVFRLKFRGGVLTTIQDKTEELKAIKLLRERTKELQKSNESLEEFAYAASHDLQEPLRKITSFSERLRAELMQKLSPPQQNLFDRLHSSTERMKVLIHDLLTYSRVSIQQQNFTPVNLAEVVEEVLQVLEGAIAETGIDITYNNLPFINGDARQLRQLFQNLFSNAIKYRKTDCKAVVRVQCLHLANEEAVSHGFRNLEKSAYYLIEVSDDGIGFEQQYEHRIFQVFQRLHGRAEYEGTGIGLAIVQKVVANHHGFIKASSSPGEGATFKILLPAV